MQNVQLPARSDEREHSSRSARAALFFVSPRTKRCVNIALFGLLAMVAIKSRSKAYEDQKSTSNILKLAVQMKKVL
jgi:hypothetical protein